MRVYLWITALANLAAHGVTLLVLLGTAKVLGDAAVIAESDAQIIFWLEAMAGVLTLGLIVALLMGKGVQKATPPTPGTQWKDPPKQPGFWTIQRGRPDR